MPWVVVVLVMMSACARSQISQFPAECNDMERLVELIADGRFSPSQPDRWANFSRPAVWPDTPATVNAAAGAGRCDIERVNAASLSVDEFKLRFLERAPVIVVGATDAQPFALMTQRQTMLYCFADFDVTLSTANKNSYSKYESSFKYYAESLMQPVTLEASGAATKYFFGDNRHDEWGALFKHYRQPVQYIFSHASLSFGSGGSGSGVPFHTHGHVFAEVLHGRKRWFLKAPGEEPRFDPDESSLRWATQVLPTYSIDEQREILDCVAGPGEMIYIPSHWHHATLNLGETVFMSTFV